jgi:hypothetical protein
MIETKLIKALESEQPLEEFRSIVRDLLAHGRSRDSIVSELEQLRSTLRAEGREEDEETILDVLDAVEGWCSPHTKI